ncbi:hypothetical protein NC796_09240 [Aliifodinibius sp. S!AR15-10]|uniref:matrixin family metalloprotease n=1 Tax=Aliifodinibius sp. S!AR15-10 TaxID=2950437 RepID=UPI0028644B6A|nr:matrixin family metalloprotease [Aliifodinibius sp. S!AR15-10]MDR8391320.1 hypothetical protein [Aliifodinibius sp. S!AR15-10]
MLKELNLFVVLLLLFLLSTSCSEMNTNFDARNQNTPILESQAGEAFNSSNRISFGVIPNMQDINKMLAENGLNMRLSHAETVTFGGGSNIAEGQTIFANDRTLRLPSQWVPGDTRRGADGNNLNYIIWGPFSLANFSTADQVSGIPAIDASFNTWNSVSKKPKLNIIKKPTTAANPSIILGGNPFLADISEIGFLPGALFDQVLEPGARDIVLGVTFTFVWVDENDNPTDINNDGFLDIALKEVWYNDDFLWTTLGNNADAIDIETVALHENGHTLGLGHFGRIFITGERAGNIRLHVAPRAVMNAIILGTQRDLLGTDNASYKSLYGDWPRN